MSTDFDATLTLFHSEHEPVTITVITTLFRVNIELGEDNRYFQWFYDDMQQNRLTLAETDELGRVEIFFYCPLTLALQ